MTITTLSRTETGLSLNFLDLIIPSMRFNVSCNNCTSQGLNVLPEVLDMLEVAAISDIMERRLVDLSLELV